MKDDGKSGQPSLFSRNKEALTDSIVSRFSELLSSTSNPPDLPVTIRLASNETLELESILRFLPGKRLVCKGNIREDSVLVKVFVGESAARHWRREKSGIEALLATGIPTPELIAAESIPDGGYLIMTRFVKQSFSLQDKLKHSACNEQNTVSTKKLVLRSFHLLGRLHACGLVHNDLHPGNILVTADNELMLIDGDAVQGVPGLPKSKNESLANLAMLVAQFPIPEPETLDEWLAAYRSGHGLVSSHPADMTLKIATAREARIKDYLSKASRNCSRYLAKRGFSYRKVVARKHALMLSTELEQPDQLMEKGCTIKQGNSATVVRVEINAKNWVIKRYNIKGFLHALSRFGRHSRGWHSWLAAHRLQALGLATPEPVAILEHRVGPFRGTAWLVTEHCVGKSLREVLDPNQIPPGEIGSALVKLFRDLASTNITHGDLKATNLLWHDGKVLLIDLDSLKHHKQSASFHKAWSRDRKRLLNNWSKASVLHKWLTDHLP